MKHEFLIFHFSFFIQISLTLPSSKAYLPYERALVAGQRRLVSGQSKAYFNEKLKMKNEKLRVAYPKRGVSRSISLQDLAEIENRIFAVLLSNCKFSSIRAPDKLGFLSRLFEFSDMMCHAFC